MDTIGDYIGKRFNRWTVIDIINDKVALCKCECGKVGEVPIYNLKSGRSKSCGCTRYDKNNLVGTKYGKLAVIEMLPDKKCRCKCDCGSITDVYRANLTRGFSKSCGKCGRQKVVGEKFNHWTILEELGNGKVKCKCDCGTVKELYKKAVVNGQTKSCGCAATSYRDLTGKQFGYWKVIEHKGSVNGNSIWRCQCTNCGSMQDQYASHLINGRTNSCRCKQGDIMKSTMLETYGEIASARITNPRQLWQIETVNNPDKLYKYINDLGYKPTIIDLSNKLDTSPATLLVKIHSAKLEDIVDIQPMRSQYEDELLEYIKEIYNGSVEISKRNIISPYELDIYIPEKSIAIEFNGNFWHNSINKDKNYHINKTKLCQQKGIRLIHIFEYEWLYRKIQIKQYLYKKLNEKCIYDIDNTHIQLVNNIDAADFINKNSVYKYNDAKANIGLMDSNKILSIVSLNDYDGDIKIVNNYTDYSYNTADCSSKVFDYIKSNLKGKNIIAEVDLAKFTGNTYIENGFRVEKYTKPQYIWVKHNEILNRHQAYRFYEKSSDEGTISDKMYAAGYNQIYDCGTIIMKLST